MGRQLRRTDWGSSDNGSSEWMAGDRENKQTHMRLEVEAMVLFASVYEEYLGIKEDLSSRRN